MAEKRHCAATLGNPKHPEQGRPCHKWAIKGSDFCAAHGGKPTDPISQVFGAHQCTATSSQSGQRCRNNAIKGGTVCKWHGGSAKQVQARAAERLQEMVHPALAQLNRIMDAPNTSDSDRLRAIGMVLDRTGHGPGAKVEVEVKPWEVTMQTVTKIIRDVPDSLRGEFDPAWSEDVIDAEVVEDEPPVTNVTNIDPRMRGSAEPPRRR